MPQQIYHKKPEQDLETPETPKNNQKEAVQQSSKYQLEILSKEDQQRLRRRSEGDPPAQKYQCSQNQSKKLSDNQQNISKPLIFDIKNLNSFVKTSGGPENENDAQIRRLSLGDGPDASANSKIFNESGELQIRCRNTKCTQSTTIADAKKYYKSCHNCTHLYCSRDCRRIHWEKHRKACLHSRASNLCRQVLATCKDDSDSQRHLSLMAYMGFQSQGRGVVRILFRSAEAAEGFIKHGFQCMGEASYVRWPDLMPAEMGLELYSELLRFSTEYRPESKMLIYVAICVVSEAPSMGQTPVRWERQLVSRCAKLKLCKSILSEIATDSFATSTHASLKMSAGKDSTNTSMEPTTDVLILTFNPQLRTSTSQRELIFSNILYVLSQRGVVLRRHYPEIFQRLQSFAEGQTDKFNPVTMHPRNSQTGLNFVCIIMPVHSDSEIVKLPSAADGGNRVVTIDVGSQMTSSDDPLSTENLLHSTS